MRIGHGYDSHVFGAGDHIRVGGISIPYSHGIEAHSDGDVLLHALCDALLGAMALGDIGAHFPDTDPRFKDASSEFFVKQVVDMMKTRSYNICNVDSTIIAEAPKMNPHVPMMREAIAKMLDVSEGAVSVKATTNEKMGWIGEGKGLAAHVVVLLAPVC